MKEIPVGKLLELSETYTTKQLKLLFDDSINGDDKKHEILTLYNKACDLNDRYVIDILLNKYNMMDIMRFDNLDLPESTQEEANESFKELYAFIKSIVPSFKIKQMKSTMVQRKDRGFNRVYGGQKFHYCYTFKSNGQAIFHIRNYLYRTKSDNVRKVAEMLDCPNDIKSGLIIDLIEWILKQPLAKTKVMDLINTYPDYPSLPPQDVVEMELGIIEVVI